MGLEPSENQEGQGFEPLIDCGETIPCDPCATVCPVGSIAVSPVITKVPRSVGGRCVGCGRCVAVCPGWAIRLVDWSYAPGWAVLTLPWEWMETPPRGSWFPVTGEQGERLGWGRIKGVCEVDDRGRGGGTRLLSVAVPESLVYRVWSVGTK